jgi:hypothetical protein
MRLAPDRLSGLPDVRLIGEPLIGRLGHVNYEGTVCLTDKVGLSVDSARPGAVACRVVSDALIHLDSAVGSEQAGDFTDLHEEFEGYWFSLPDVRPMNLHLVADDHAREIVARVSTDRECRAFIDQGASRLDPYGGVQRYDFLHLGRVRALYIPLATAVLPPTPARGLSTDLVREWVAKNVSSDNRLRLDKILKSWPRSVTDVYLLLSQPRPSGPLAVFGVHLQGRGGRHPLLEQRAGWKAVPLLARRHTAQELRSRGGATDALAKRRVAVIGCGAVGSRIAEHLALAGVGGLVLVDPEKLDPDNVYRHVLGGDAVEISKARALKSSLERRVPSLVIEAEAKRLDEWASRKSIAGVDGIVLATGVPHFERDFIRATRGWPELRGPIVSTWLEPMGLGGHMQCTLPDVAGCLECLYTDANGAAQLFPKVAFAEPGQILSRNLTGCAGSFTPYSALDATQTALVATRAITNALTGGGKSTYSAWRGDDRAFVELGLRTTPWYQSVNDAELFAAALEYSKVRCPVCGGTR